MSPDVKIRLMEMERELDRATILRYLEELEGKLAELRRVVEGGPGLEMLRGVRSVDKEGLAPLIDWAFRGMGIQDQPIGPERVQELIAACGVRPEMNAFSRGLIGMREE